MSAGGLLPLGGGTPAGVNIRTYFPFFVQKVKYQKKACNLISTVI